MLKVFTKEVLFLGGTIRVPKLTKIQEDLVYPHSTVQDLLWDGLHYICEPLLKYWPFNTLRERAMKRTIELLLYNAEESRYVTTGAVEKVSYVPISCEIC